MSESSSSQKSDVTSAGFEDTELTLGLPGLDARSSPPTIGRKSCVKRGFTEAVDPEYRRSSDNGPPRGKTSDADSTAPANKAQVVGWPPVRSFRKKAIESCKYVKVAVDGAPYLRKVDIRLYGSYQDLLEALQEMFTCFTIHGGLGDNWEECKLVDEVKGMEYVPSYEDKDGDWMLVGDVPWKMFMESCKRIRLMKSSEAMGLGALTKSDVI